MGRLDRFEKGTRVVVIGGEGQQEWIGSVDGYRFNYIRGGTDIVLVPDKTPAELRFLDVTAHTIREEGTLL